MKTAINVLSEIIVELYFKQKIDNDSIFLILIEGIARIQRTEEKKEKVEIIKALQTIVLNILEQLKNNENVTKGLKRVYYSFYFILTRAYNKFATQAEEILPVSYFNLSEKDFED
ncbi:hypothetical protein LF845_06245 [Deferribacterales bacterium Es71-Z0220]|uniref:hypothetical protein n=1 Tax=Deferrivibrio essentukiensis TaxID=2880922 RepID=UPI001F6146AB|nr:hypothetical protein [Deferrivibrio essentukiensis]MCB4204556.1 hypothetical protein [Deferrivibrio essentukiensis]